MGNDGLLRTQGLTKHFGEVYAVDGVSLTLERDVLTSIIGPNGAGKTTLVNLLSGNLQPDSGQIFFRGEEITRLPAHGRVRLGICRSFQIMNIFSKLNVYRNIQIPVLARLGLSSSPFSRLDGRAEVREEVERILATIGLMEKQAYPAEALSHGDQRLLEIGIALAAEPELLFFDEPTAGLNPVERVKILENIRSLSEERHATFVIIEHDMDVVFSLSNRIVVMHRGRVIADGPPEMIKEDKGVREIYLGQEVR